MASSNSRFNIIAVRGKRRLVLHRSLRELSTAVRIACEFSVLRPAKLDGLFICDATTGATWSVSDLVERMATTEAKPDATAEGRPEPLQAAEPLQAEG